MKKQIVSIDGTSIYHMLRFAFTSLSFNESYLNDINTFPVSDSDTGTNMKRTFRKGLLATGENQTAGSALVSFAKNMSMDSRGNSGFILSQYFLGLSEYLKDKDSITLEDFSEAIVHAYKVAYAAVLNPMEGTMLTVMRVGAMRALEKLQSMPDASFADFFEIFSQSIFSAVLQTHSQMGLLEANNVVDSGALGFYLVIDGMKKSFDEEEPYFNCSESTTLPKRVSDADNPLTFFRYCTEFTIDLKERHSKEYFSEILSGRGDSIVVAINENLLKVHIHTNAPSTIIKEFGKFGRLVFTKADDLFETPQFERLKRRKHVGYAVVAFTNGDQTATLYERLGVDAAFPVPKGHVPTEEELKKLLEPYLDGKLVVYSADRKIEDLLKSMHWWGGYKNLFVVECRGLANTFFKLASSMFDGSFEDFKKQSDLLKKIKTTEFRIAEGEDLKSQLKQFLSPKRLNGYSTLAVFGGRNISQDDINTITSFFAENVEIEFNYFPGGQDDPLVIIGAM